MNKPVHLQINLHRLDGSVEEPRVTSADIPEHVMESLARATIDAAKRFYSDPENVRKFEEWKARKAEDSQQQE